LVLDVKDEHFLKSFTLEVLLVVLLIIKKFPPQVGEVKELVAEFTLEYFLFGKKDSSFGFLLKSPSPQKPFE
jgi:hypothetical protein